MFRKRISTLYVSMFIVLTPYSYWKLSGGITFRNCSSFATRSFSSSGKRTNSWLSCTSITIPPCSRYGGSEWNGCPAVPRSCRRWWTVLYTCSCTRTTRWAPWAQMSWSIYGGKSTWPYYSWFVLDVERFLSRVFYTVRITETRCVRNVGPIHHRAVFGRSWN